MMFAERAAAIEAFGFTARQATFLTIVALHSGYCLRRQYAAFVGVEDGKNVRRFLDGLVERKVAGRIVFGAERGTIYHLFGSRLYAAIGHLHSANRRHASPPQIARKLMLLDFVLAHPDFDWHATEADKVDLFVTRLGIPSSPGLAITRLPIFRHGASPCVNFVCVVTDPRGSSIESFVRDHAPLLRQLTDWTLYALIPQHVSTDEVCDAVYRRALAARSMSTMSASKEDMEWFANTRTLVAAGDLRTIGMDDLRRYRTLSSSLEQRLETRFVNPVVVHHLPHSYAQFGFFAGLT